MTPAAVHRAARRLRVELGRHDVNAFVEYVARDEETGRPVRQAPMHRAWHALLDTHPLLVLWAPIMHGKSQQISILRVVWLLGRDASMRIVIASNAERQAAKFVRTIAQHITDNPRVREVFPRLKPARGLPWSSSQLVVERPGIQTDPSVQLISLHGNILSARVDLIVVDDILDYESVRTPAQREDTIAWVQNALIGRLSTRGRMVVTGVAQHREDLMHYLSSRSPTWIAYRFAALDTKGEPRWPAKWPLARIQAKRLALGPQEASRQLDCRASSGVEGYVRWEWIQRGLTRGEGMTTVERRCDLTWGAEAEIYHGVDLGARAGPTSDLTSIFTIGVHPNGIRQILQVKSGRWVGQDRLNRLVDAYRRFGGTLVIENVAFQDEVLEALREMRRGMEIIGFTTGKGEKSLEFQVDRLLAELTRGQWVIPNIHGSCEPEVSRWIDELSGFDPAAHTGDRLAASCFARWGADNAAKMVGEVGYVDLLSR